MKKKELLSGLFLSAVAMVAGQGLQFANISLLTYVFTAEEYGRLMLVLSIVSVGAIFARFGLQPAILKFGVKTDHFCRKLYASVIELSIVVPLIASILIGVAASILYQNEAMPGHPWVVAVVVSLVTYGVAVNGLNSAVYRINGKVFSAALSTKAVEQSIYFLVIILMITGVNLSVSGYLFSTATIIFVAAVVLRRVALSGCHNYISVKSLKNNIDSVLLVFSFSCYAYLVNLSQIVIKNTDFLMLNSMSEALDLGYYALAHRYSEIFSAAGPIVNLVFARALAGSVGLENRRSFNRFVFQATAINILAFLALTVTFIIVHLKFDFLLGDWINESTPYLKILWIGKIASAFTACITLALILNGMVKQVAYVLAIACAMNILLNRVLIEFYGTYGAAYATTTTLVVVAFANLIILFSVVSEPVKSSNEIDTGE